MAWYDEFAARVGTFSVAEWEELPDLGLYMDQVITYLERQFRPLYGEERRIVTPSMINNYVKGGLVARPVSKKYDRAQIAQLMMLCALKQALSLEDLRLLTRPPEGGGVEDVYRAFCAQLREVSASFESRLGDLTPMRCAVLGASYGLLCEEILRAEE